MVTGFDDRQHLSSRLQSHEESKQHLEACKIHETWCSRGIIDDVMDSSIRKEENYWRQVLQRIINVPLPWLRKILHFEGTERRARVETAETSYQ